MKVRLGEIRLSHKKVFSEFEIELPIITEQQSIAAVFEKIYELIKKWKLQLEKLDLLVKSQNDDELEAAV